MSDPRENATLVDQMGSLLRDEAHALSTGPTLLRRILETEAWRHFVTQRGDEVEPRSFDEFVTTKPLKGLGAEVAFVRTIASSDVVTLDLLDQARQRRNGRPEKTLDNVQGSAPTGNRADRTLRQLRTKAPELHAEVLAGNLSPNAAAIQAGFRKPTLSIPIDTPEAALKALSRRFTWDQLRAAMPAPEEGG